MGFGVGGGEEEVGSGLGNLLTGMHDMIVLQYVAEGGGKGGGGRERKEWEGVCGRKEGPTSPYPYI